MGREMERETDREMERETEVHLSLVGVWNKNLYRVEFGIYVFIGININFENFIQMKLA